ncbi:hypothetical protein G6F37_006899 [Rhizopus arrhizus]|nr:hypothetical protein G6F38_008915 [Rhizopus arrhizus]KAG1157219.1 hypothetical protein G6F37_006899 [Rhizopus arrhizus]
MKRAPRKVEGESKAKKTVRTVLGHHFDFISAALDVLDRHEKFKGHCLIMANSPIHNSDPIASRRYGCVYLPPYSPGLHPMEPFCSVVKSKMEREKLLNKKLQLQE